MDKKKRSKCDILKRINGHLKNSTIGVVIIVVLLVLIFVGMYIDNVEKAKETQNLRKESIILQQEAAAQQEYEEVFEKIDADIKIVCWGDDISDINGKSSFTHELQRMLDNNGYSAKVINMNIPGDTTKDVMVRCGALRILLDNEITIPSAPILTEIAISTEDGSELTFLKHGKNQATVRIGGIWGLLTYNESKNAYFFERKADGDKTVIAPGTPVTPKDAIAYQEFFPIISVGMNGGWDDDVYTLIEQQQAILDACTYNQGNFFIIGFNSYGEKASEESLKITEQALLNQWGNHYLNMRRYLSDDGVLNSSGIELSEQDLVQLTVGIVPDAVKRDKKNLTESGSSIVGQLVYYAMEKQGCLPEE